MHQDGDSQAIFTAAITDLAVSNYNRNFTAKPYVKVKYSDGNDAKIYATETITRSIYAVAAGLLKNTDSNAVDGGDTDYSTEKKGLYNVLNAYVNMVGICLSMDENGTFANKVTIMSYWNEFVRINNNHSVVAANISNSVVNEDGSVTFTFTVTQK